MQNNYEDSAYNDDEFTIVDLDGRDQADRPRASLPALPRSPSPSFNLRFLPWVRRGMVSLTIVGTLALFVLLWPYAQQAFFHNQITMPPVSASYETSLDLSLFNDVVSVHASNSKGSSLDGLHIGNGSQLWHYGGAIIGKPINLSGVLYVLTPTSVDALQIQTGKLLWLHKYITNAQELLVSDGIVYVHSILPKTDKEPGSPEIISALGIGDGQLVWQYTTRGFNQPLQAKNGFVYIYSTSGQQELRASDGKVVWQHPNGIFVSIPSYIGDGVVYVYSTQPIGGDYIQVGSIDAVRSSDGGLLWRHSANGMVIHVEKNIVYIYRQQDERIEALRMNDGKTLWRYQMKGGDQPLFNGDVVYVHTENGPAALNANDGRLIWQSKTSVDTLRIDNGILYSYSPDAGSVVALSASSGKLLWQHQAPADSTLTVANGVVYIRQTLAGAVLNALRGSDGAALWQQKTNGDVLQVQNDRMYTSSQADGTLDALSVQNGKLLWHYQAPGGK
ncbi:MAG: PQQ-binding-like beta-propeller repeat protein [Ktedonobacteraceae bacterium]|nr:PQQ-binding-like beta-propeller repeat protein [Ktedonobacteraceae bacterium]